MIWDKPLEGSIDIGHDHWLHYSAFAPDRALNPQYEWIPDDPKHGATIWHREIGGDGGYHAGGVVFDTVDVREIMRIQGREQAVWQVQSWEPLTISSSVLCQCGDHGYIREGKWVPA